MEMARVWSYLRGYVLLVLEGEGIEKFINLALSKGIQLWDIVRLPTGKAMLKVCSSSFNNLRPVARRTRCRVRIQRKTGLPFVMKKLREQKILVGGGLFFLAALYLLTSFVWSVQVVPHGSLEYITPEQILGAAAEQGLQRGALRKRVDFEKIEKNIVNRVPEVAWVGIELAGTKAKIKVVEKVLIPPRYQQGPGHLVAMKDGVIKEILVMSGEPKVTEGETVKRGQILISGQVNQGYVQARGIVRGRVWYQAKGSVGNEETTENLTGRSTREIKLRIGNREITLKKSSADFTYFQTEQQVKSLPMGRILKVPVESIITVYHEVERKTRVLSYGEAKLAAEQQALNQLLGQVPGDSKITSRDTFIQLTEQGRVQVTVLIETVEDIGQLQLFNPTG